MFSVWTAFIWITLIFPAENSTIFLKKTRIWEIYGNCFNLSPTEPWRARFFSTIHKFHSERILLIIFPKQISHIFAVISVNCWVEFDESSYVYAPLAEIQYFLMRFCIFDIHMNENSRFYLSHNIRAICDVFVYIDATQLNQLWNEICTAVAFFIHPSNSLLLFIANYLHKLFDSNDELKYAGVTLFVKRTY